MVVYSVDHSRRVDDLNAVLDWPAGAGTRTGTVLGGSPRWWHAMGGGQRWPQSGVSGRKRFGDTAYASEELLAETRRRLPVCQPQYHARASGGSRGLPWPTWASRPQLPNCLRRVARRCGSRPPSPTGMTPRHPRLSTFDQRVSLCGPLVSHPNVRGVTALQGYPPHSRRMLTPL